MAKGLRFDQLKSVNNPRSVHGIYPYRGKISSVDASKIVAQMPEGISLLDPFCGSGTIVYEAAKFGLDASGIDASPLAVLVSNGKLQIPADFEEVESELSEHIKRAKASKLVPLKRESARHFHQFTWNQISQLARRYEKMSPYLKACFVGAISLSARGCNWYKWTSSSVGKNFDVKKKIDFNEKFQEKVRKHFFPIDSVGKVFLGDARKPEQTLRNTSVDAVFTSPPYFDCLDYTSYYARIVFDVLGWDREGVRTSLIQTYKSYESDMKDVFDGLSRVIKPGGVIIFVVGDKKIHGEVVNGGEFFRSIAPWRHVRTVERSYSGTSSSVFDSINKTSRREQIVVWAND